MRMITVISLANGMLGWTLSLTEYKETIPTLWETTQEFMRKHPDYIVRSNSLLAWVTDDEFLTYNGCHFWSNFEVNAFMHACSLPLKHVNILLFMIDRLA